MTDQEWDDDKREELRARLRSAILGEVRLAKRDREDIVESCCEVCLEDECPESEAEIFFSFAEDELQRAVAQLESEQASWPKETDCDRLDGVEAALNQRGIVLWQASPCCDTCTCSELGGRIDEIERRLPGFRNKVRGYAFFIDQNLPEALADGTNISVYLGYGWVSPDGSEVPPAVYEQHALGIAREVCDSLRAAGFEVDWDGDLSRKIGLSLNWQRRTMLD